jgi:basic membrane protein A and related proteins
MRKSIVLLLVFGLLLPLIAACGGAPAAEESAPTAAPAATATPAATAAPAEAEPAPETEAPDMEPVQVGLVTDIGKVNDGTFNEFAHAGATRAAEEFGLDYRYIETVAQADYEANLQTFINEEYEVIITVGFLLEDANLAAAQANPDITFIGVDQFFADENAAPNLVGIQFREDQAGFLAGAMAGMMTETGTVGVVAGLEIPPVVRFRNGFDNGARYVFPDINLLGTYVPSFTDSAQGITTAQQMLGEGADVIFGAGGQMGSAAIAYAAQEGAYVIGVDQDEYNTTFERGATPGVENLLTSAVKRVDVAVYDQIRQVLEGTFEGDGIVLYEAANDGVGYADFHEAADAIPDSVKQRMQEILTKLADGSLTTGVDPASGEIDAATIPEPEPFVP